MRWTRVVVAAAIGAGLIGCLAPSISRGAVSTDVQHLPFRRAVIPIGALRARAVLEEDSVLASGAAPDFADLRLMNDAGAGLAMTREPLRRMDEIFTDWRAVPLRWREEPNGVRWMTIDLGDAVPPDLILALQGPVANHAMTVEGSADSSDWSTLTQRYDISMPPPKDNRFNTQRIALAETRRWLRLKQDPPFNAPSVDDRLDLLLRVERATPRTSAAYRIDSGYERVEGAIWEARLELTGPARALTRLDLIASDAVRSQLGFEVQARLPRGGWQFVPLEHVPEWRDGSRDSLLFAPIRTTALRVVVTGGDAPNAPIEIQALWATPERWTFETAAGPPWWLAWGDPFLAPADGMNAPSIAMPPGAGYTAGAALSPTRLGPPEPNPFHREPGFGLEWLRRRPIVLSVAMVAILALAVFLARRPTGRSGVA